MSRRFRLATLERLRASGLDRATRDLAAARRRVAETEQLIEELREQIAASVTARTTTPTDLTTAAARREALRDQVDRLAGELAARRDDVARATTAWHTARADLRAVEALHERHRLAEAAEDARREQRIVDELAGVRAAFPGLGPVGVVRRQAPSGLGGDAA